MLCSHEMYTVRQESGIPRKKKNPHPCNTVSVDRFLRTTINIQ